VSVALAGGLTLLTAVLVATVRQPRLTVVPPASDAHDVTEPVRHAM
jgi:hypothetical protein